MLAEHPDTAFSHQSGSDSLTGYALAAEAAVVYHGAAAGRTVLFQNGEADAMLQSQFQSMSGPCLELLGEIDPIPGDDTAPAQLAGWPRG